MKILVCSRDNGKTLGMCKELEKALDNGERVVFMTRNGYKELSELLNAPLHDDVPDHIRYQIEYLQRRNNNECL